MSQKKRENYFEELDYIWSKISKSNVSGFQRNILYHILGREQDGIEIQTISYLYDNPLATNKKLYEYLEGAIKKLITYAYIGVERESKLTQHYTNKIQTLEHDLKRKDELIEFYKTELKREQEKPPVEKIITKTEIEYVRVKVPDDKEVNRLNGIIRDLENQLSSQPTNIESSPDMVEATLYEDALNDNKQLKESYDKEIEALKEKNKELSKIVDKYKKDEKKIVPILRKSVFQQQYQGKCITLEPSQIEGIIRRYLNGESSYEISKATGISKTSVNSIIHCEYRAVQSLKKVLNALHMVNKEGHWGEDKQNTLNELIKTYNKNINSVIEARNVKMKGVKENINSIDSFLYWTNQKKIEIKSRDELSDESVDESSVGYS